MEFGKFQRVEFWKPKVWNFGISLNLKLWNKKVKEREIKPKCEIKTETKEKEQKERKRTEKQTQRQANQNANIQICLKAPCHQAGKAKSAFRKIGPKARASGMLPRRRLGRHTCFTIGFRGVRARGCAQDSLGRYMVSSHPTHGRSLG